MEMEGYGLGRWWLDDGDGGGDGYGDRRDCGEG
nr:hypothetical protein [Tanacetum cinerariifolium]